MTIICKPSKVIPVTMCGANKNSSHGDTAFSAVEPVCQSDDVDVIKSSTKESVEVAQKQ